MDLPPRGGKWEFVAAANMPTEVSSYTFSGLKGHKDLEYLIEGMVFVFTGTNKDMLLQVNGSSSNMFYTMAYKYWGGGSGRQDGSNTYQYAYTPVGGGSYPAIYLSIHIQASVHSGGYPRAIKSVCGALNSNAVFSSVNGGGWNDTSSEITSLTLTSSSGTFGGYVYLYRRRV